MHRFFVIESRRLLPLLFLLVLLVSLSVYDNFFKADRAVTTPVEELENILTFVTAGRGEMVPETSFQVIDSQEEWQNLREEYPAFPDYPFNADYELLVSSLHGEIRNIGIFPQEEGPAQLRVQVSLQPQAYHLVTVDKEKVGAHSVWQFVDTGDQVLSEIALPVVASPETEEEEENGEWEPGTE
ncbi:MAG: hypothetical protein GX973_01920 [Firmicutes bacterium]|nr:hypothetical protein [Bacillota bacterium]